jgi:hypothetical protein
MSISDYERKKLLEKAAKLKAEKDGSGQPAESLSKQQEQDQQIDQRLEQAQAAAKATGKFAKDLAVKTAKLAEVQAQRAKAKADAWKQEQEVKRAEEAERKMPLSTVEPKTPAVEGRDQDRKNPGKNPTLVAVIGAVVLVGAGALGYMATRANDAAPPLTEPVTQVNQVETSPPEQPEPETKISEPVIEPAPQIMPKPEPQVEPAPLPVVIEVPPKALEAPKAVQVVERTSRPVEKKYNPPKSAEPKKPKKEDWQDKASSDLDKFAEQFK